MCVCCDSPFGACSDPSIGMVGKSLQTANVRQSSPTLDTASVGNVSIAKGMEHPIGIIVEAGWVMEQNIPDDGNLRCGIEFPVGV